MIFHKAAIFVFFPSGAIGGLEVVSGYPYCRVEISRGVKHFDDVFNPTKWTLGAEGGSLSTDGKIGTLSIATGQTQASISRDWNFNTTTYRYAVVKATDLTGTKWRLEAKLSGAIKASKEFTDTGIKTVDLQNDGVATPPYLGDIDQIVLLVEGAAGNLVKFDYVKICEKTLLRPSDDFDVIEATVYLAVAEEVGSVNCLLQNFEAKYTDQISVGDLIEVAMTQGSDPYYKVFKGRIESISKIAEATLRGLQHYLRLKGRDLGAELFNRLVTKRYVNQEGSTIVKDVLSNFTLLEGIGVESTSSTYAEEEYENKPAWEIIKYIAETAKNASNVIGYDFKCEEGDLKFFYKSKYTSAVDLTDLITLVEYEKAIERVRNKLYVYGEASKPLPLDRDAWTETLDINNDGTNDWASGTGTGTVSLDNTEKIKGSYSIKTNVTTADYYGCAILTLPTGYIVNCNKYPSLTFQIKAQTTYCGDITVQLEDTAGMIVRREVKIRLGEWNLLQFMCGRKHSDEWTHSLFNTQDFNWEQIKKVVIFCHFSGAGTGAFWVDNLFFDKCRWSAVAEDATSQDKYGVRELAITDETLISDDACAKVAQAELKYRKDPAEFLRVTVIGDPRIVAGEMIHVTSLNEGIDANYRIQSVEHWMNDEGEFESRLTLIAEPPRVATILAETREEMGTLMRGTAYRKLGR